MGTVDLMREKKAKLLKWIPFFTMLAILIAGYTILIFQISKDKNREVCIEVDNAVDREETVGVEMHIVKTSPLEYSALNESIFSGELSFESFGK